MLRQQEERFRGAWSSAVLFGTAVLLAVAGTVLLLPPGVPDASVRTPLPGDAEPVVVAQTWRDTSDRSAQPLARQPRRPSPVQRAEPVHDRPPPTSSGRPARVRVEAIGVDAAVVPLGVDAEGHLEVPDDFSVAGWWQGGAEPGEPGPAVIVGHVDSHSGPAIFYRLQELEVGDEVVLTLDGGQSLSYRVTGKQEVPKNGFPTEAVYGHTPASTLRLITCGGPFDRVTGHYRHNVIVFAEVH